MQTVSQQSPPVNPQFAVPSRNFDAFCASVREAFPAWGRNVQIIWKATQAGPVAAVRPLGGFTLTAGDVTAIAALAAPFAPAETEAPAVSIHVQPIVVTNWPHSPRSGRARKPSIKMGRGSAWAGVR